MEREIIILKNGNKRKLCLLMKNSSINFGHCIMRLFFNAGRKTTLPGIAVFMGGISSKKRFLMQNGSSNTYSLFKTRE